jgi:mannose-6-phosphate isomerase-like protein (cupin superfamily)
VIQTDPYYYRYLCTELTGKKMTPIIGTITATDIREVGGYLRHEGEEMVYVLDGTLEVHTEFYEPLQVETGGCIYFDSTMGHAFLAVGGKPVTFLSVTSGPETVLQEAEVRRSEAIAQAE